MSVIQPKHIVHMLLDHAITSGQNPCEDSPWMKSVEYILNITLNYLALLQSQHHCVPKDEGIFLQSCMVDLA